MQRRSYTGREKRQQALRRAALIAWVILVMLLLTIAAKAVPYA